jgi:hypothetical protein
LLDKKRRAEPDTDAVEQVPKKRGKKTSIYGDILDFVYSASSFLVYRGRQ